MQIFVLKKFIEGMKHMLLLYRPFDLYPIMIFTVTAYRKKKYQLISCVESLHVVSTITALAVVVAA